MNVWVWRLGGRRRWQQARRLRPERALVLEEHEALNECGWGFTWRRRDDEDLWDAVQPSSYPEDKPSSGIHAEASTSSKEGTCNNLNSALKQ